MAHTLEELEKAVAGLPPEQLKAFRAWYQRFDAEYWDRQIEQDVVEGRLESLAEAALIEHEKGKTREL